MKENRKNRKSAYNTHRSIKAARRAKARKAKFLRRLAFSFVAVTFLSITAIGPFGLFRSPNTTTVEAVSQERDLKYKIVDIEYGDSLWTIASEYYSTEFDDMNDYIEMIRTCNHLNSDNITAGASLMIPYYE